MTIEELKEKVKTELIAETIEAIKNGQDSELFNAVRTKLNKEYHVIKRGVTSKEKPNMDYLLNIVMNSAAHVYGVTVPDIIGRSRKAPLPDARHTVVYITRLLSGNQMPIDYVSKSMNLDHSTGIHAVKKITGIIETNKQFRDKIDLIIGLCKKEL
jgi:hypothetical protein